MGDQLLTWNPVIMADELSNRCERAQPQKNCCGNWQRSLCSTVLMPLQQGSNLNCLASSNSPLQTQDSALVWSTAIHGSSCYVAAKIERERAEGEAVAGGIQYPRATVPGVLFTARAARMVLEASRRPCPRSSKREGISFLILIWLDRYISSPYIERFT